MLYHIEKIIDVSDWDDLVSRTYGRPYSFQQQDGCKSRGLVRFSVLGEEDFDMYENATVPEIVNHDERGVSFTAWLGRDPTKLLEGEDNTPFDLLLWWERNFYPDFETVANDLCARGLLEAGDYSIDIDW